jgi:quercetin dioxygenase-like cupin family protein
MEHAVGNIYVRPNPMPYVGMKCGDHEHNFDHMTQVIVGEIDITARNRAREVLWKKRFKAGDYVLIKAEVSHEIECIVAPALFHCIYAHRTPQGDVVQEYTGYEDAYR